MWAINQTKTKQTSSEIPGLTKKEKNMKGKIQQSQKKETYLLASSWDKSLGSSHRQ